MRRGRGDEGSAVVEFCYLAVLLMVPLVYLIVAVFRLQAAAYGAAAAARDAGRAYVTSDAAAMADERARAAAGIVLRDQRVGLPLEQLSIACSSTPCLTPAGSVTVRITLDVPVPGAPALFGAGPPSITVSATHVEIVDPYRVPPP